MLSSTARNYWQEQFTRYLEHGTPLLPSPVQQQQEGRMQSPYGEYRQRCARPDKANSYDSVQVTLTATSKHNEVDRSFRLGEFQRDICIGRASSRGSGVESAMDNNCYLNSPIVSRKHGRFIIGDRTHPLKLVDHGSTHGTFVNEIKISPHQELALMNNSKIEFGNTIIHGTCKSTSPMIIRSILSRNAANYRPTMFRVSFTWHDPVIPDVIPDSFPTFQPSAAIRAPTPASDSEDEENNVDVDGQTTPYARSPSVVVLNGPAYIDLTGDIVDDPEYHSVGQNATSKVEVHEVESDEPLLWETDGQGNNLMAKRAESVTTNAKASYGFDYNVSDTEDEELELASQSSPPPKDFDSLYDDSDDLSLVESSPASYHTEETGLKIDEVQNQDEEDEEEGQWIPDRYSQRAQEVDNQSETNGVNRLEELTEGIFSPIVEPADLKDLTSYSQSLQWLGVGKLYDAKSIVDSCELRMAADPDIESIALECVQVIAENTLDEKLALALDHWLHTGKLLEYETEHGLESDESEGSSTRSGPVASPVELTTGAIELPSVPSQPPAPRTNYINQDYTSGRELPHFTSYSPEFHTAYNSSSCYTPAHPHRLPFGAPSLGNTNFGSQPSPVMRISNLVDKVPTELQPTKSDSLPARSEEILPVGEPHEEQREEQPKGNSKALEDMFDGSDKELLGAETIVIDQQKLLDIIRSRASRVTGQKRKLCETDLEQHEHVPFTAPAVSNELTGSSSLPEECLPDAQTTSLRHDSHDRLNSWQTLAENMVEEFRGQPQRQKRKTSAEPHHRPSLLKTIATHCIAGAIGAVGLVAAIVSTTPTQLKEELFYQKR